MLTGCGGSQPPIGASGTMPQSRSSAAYKSVMPFQDQPVPATMQTAHQSSHPGISWMASDATSQDLLYVTSNNDVNVYSYPAGKTKGVLTGFNSPVGDCVDRSGNVFITNQMPAVIYEYKHGGTKRIATLKVDSDDVGPVGCAVDPSTGNLAVTGFSHGADIFKGARGTPTFYKDKNFYAMQFCAYDDKGNLFVSGNATMKRTAVAELSNGSAKFTELTLTTPVAHDAGIQWTGRRLAVGGFFPIKSDHPVIYRYDIVGQTGTETGMTPLGSPAYESFQFLIDGATVVVPNWAKTGNHPYSVLFYSFPKGGAPQLQIEQHVAYPRGVVVSRAR
jgi:hypothetical protein